MPNLSRPRRKRGGEGQKCAGLGEWGDRPLIVWREPEHGRCSSDPGKSIECHTVRADFILLDTGGLNRSSNSELFFSFFKLEENYFIIL